MAFKVILAALAVSSTLAFPAEPTVSQTPVPIISQNSDFNGNGNFTYSYESGDGIKLQQAGFVKQIPPGERKAVEGEQEGAAEAQVINGSFSYTAPDGTAIELQYTADENGFHPQGSHLPTPPPIPEEIQNLLNSLPSTEAPATK